MAYLLVKFCAIFEPTVLHGHQYLILLICTLEDALSKIKGDLIKDRRTSKAMDNWAKQNTTFS